MTVARLARRWWFLVLPMFLVAIGLALLVAQSVPITYQAKGAVLFEPPGAAPADTSSSSSSDLTNKFAGSGSDEVLAARLVATVMDNKSVRDELKAKGASDYTVSQSDNTLPLLDIEAESDNSQQALHTIQLLADAINQELAAQQQASSVAAQALITARPLLPTDRTDAQYAGRIRAGLAVGALGFAASLSVPFVMEAVYRNRRRPVEPWTADLYSDVPRLAAAQEEREPAGLSDARD